MLSFFQLLIVFIFRESEINDEDVIVNLYPATLLHGQPITGYRHSLC